MGARKAENESVAHNTDLSPDLASESTFGGQIGGQPRFFQKNGRQMRLGARIGHFELYRPGIDLFGVPFESCFNMVGQLQKNISPPPNHEKWDLASARSA